MASDDHYGIRFGGKGRQFHSSPSRWHIPVNLDKTNRKKVNIKEKSHADKR